MKLPIILPATLLLGLALGYGIGWKRGNLAAGETPLVTGGNLQQTVGNTAAPAPSGARRATSSDAAATAKRLLDEVIHSDSRASDDPIARIQFQQALSQCDEVALSEMLEQMQKSFSSDPENFFTNYRNAEDQLRLMIHRMATLDPMKALDAVLVFKTVNDEQSAYALELIFTNLSQKDPAQIPAALAKMDAYGHKSAGECAWMLTQAKTNPDAVFQYLTRSPDNNPISEWDFKEVATRLGLYAPEKTLATIRQLSGLGIAENVFADVFVSWADRDSAAATAYAMQQKDAELLRWCAGRDLTPTDFLALRQIFPEVKSSDPNDRANLAANLAENLAEQDVKAARQWVDTLLPAEQAMANIRIAKRWIDKDPVAASEWLATWPAGKDKEGAVGRLISKIQEDDPERAITWATSCLQGRDRYESLARIMKCFQKKDTAAAAAARAGLSDDDRTVLKYTETNEPVDPFAS